MADLPRLETALRNAHAAGDTAAATRLAQEIKTQRPNRYRDMVENRPSWVPEWWARTAAGINASGEGLAQGTTLGFADEALAGLDSIGERQTLEDQVRGETPYRRNVREQRSSLEDARDFAPAATMAGEIGGGLVLPFKGGGLRSAVGQSAAYGTAYGAGSAEGNAVERVDDSLMGTAMGGAIGAGGYGVGKLLGAVATGLKGASASARQRALDMVQRRLEASGLDPSDIQTALNELRAAGGATEEALMDVGGQNVQGLARATANVEGPGKEIVRQRLVERSVGPNPDQVTNENLQGSARRIAERGWSQMTGSRKVPDGGSFQEMVRGVNETARDAARPLYEAATATPFPADTFEQSFMPLFRDPDIGPIWQKTAGRALLSVRGKPGTGEQRALAALARGKSPVGSDITVGVLHRLRRAVNDEIGAAARAGENGLAADLTSFRNDFMDPWITASPAGSAYNTARQTVHGGHQMTEALSDGQKIFTTAEPDFWARASDLSDPERQAYALGAMRSIVERAGRSPNARDAIKLILSGNMRERLRAVWPRDDKGSMRPVNDFFRRLSRERKMQETMNFILGGSRTAPLNEEIAEATLREAPMAQVLDAIDGVIRGGSAAQPFRNAASEVFNRFRRPGVYNPKINREVADVVSQPLNEKLIAELAAARGRAAGRQTVRTAGGEVGARTATAASRRREQR